MRGQELADLHTTGSVSLSAEGETVNESATTGGERRGKTPSLGFSVGFRRDGVKT